MSGGISVRLSRTATLDIECAMRAAVEWFGLGDGRGRDETSIDSPRADLDSILRFSRD